MKFQFDNKTYILEFERRHRNVNVMRKGQVRTIPSTYPYTTVSLVQLAIEEGRVTRSYKAVSSVGCSPADKYSKAEGNMEALRALTSSIRKTRSKEFIGTMWNAYMHRGTPGISVSSENVTQHLLPASSLEAPTVH